MVVVLDLEYLSRVVQRCLRSAPGRLPGATEPDGKTIAHQITRSRIGGTQVRIAASASGVGAASLKPDKKAL